MEEATTKALYVLDIGFRKEISLSDGDNNSFSAISSLFFRYFIPALQVHWLFAAYQSENNDP